MIIRELHDEDKPLCPRAYGPVLDHAHAMFNVSFNRMHTAAAAIRDADEEYTDPVMNKVMELAQGPGNRMDLYRESINIHQNRVSVVAYYFMCPTCGFILPATDAQKY